MAARTLKFQMQDQHLPRPQGHIHGEVDVNRLGGELTLTQGDILDGLPQQPGGKILRGQGYQPFQGVIGRHRSVLRARGAGGNSIAQLETGCGSALAAIQDATWRRVSDRSCEGGERGLTGSRQAAKSAKGESKQQCFILHSSVPAPHHRARSHLLGFRVWGLGFGMCCNVTQVVGFPDPKPSAPDPRWHRPAVPVHCIDTVPRPRGVVLGGEALGGGAIDVTLRAVAQDLRQGRGEVVDVMRREAVLGLGHQGAIAVVGVCGSTNTQHAIEGIIGIRLAAIIEQVACGIVVICIIKSGS